MKRTVLLSLIAGTALAAMADVTLPQTVEVKAPEILVSASKTNASSQLVKRADTKRLLSQVSPTPKFKQGNDIWRVVSDRSHNTTYTSPSSSSAKYKELNLNQEVNIAKIENGFALVYTDVKNGKPFQITDRAESWGWVPVQNLLLWRTCPTDERGIFEKALVVVHVDELNKENVEKIDKEINRVRTNPNMESTWQAINPQKFYFVMKEEGDRVLLASDYKLDGTSSQVLVGWISKASFTPWNQRSCIEPNWNKTDFESALRGKTINCYDDSLCKNKKSSITFTSPNRMAPSMFRYPLMNNKRDNLYFCTSFIRTDGVMETQVSSGGDFEEKIKEFMETTKQINLIIVIDGTDSMEPYYREVKNAIQTGLGYFKDMNDLHIGVVIYRDKADGNAMVEVLPLTKPTDPRLISFLDKGGALGYGIKSAPNDNSMEEDMYAGIEAALDMNRMGYNPKQSNMVLLIGDCGNEPDDAKLNSLINKLAENNIQVMAYQTNYDSRSGAYGRFRSQVQHIVKNNLDKQLGKLKTTRESRFLELSDGTGRNFKIKKGENDSDLYIGSIRYPNRDGKLANKELENMIINNLKDYSQIIDNQLAVLMKSVTIETSSGNNFNNEWLENKIGPDNIKKFKQKVPVSAANVYVHQAIPDNRDIKYWKPVIFISDDEFKSMMGSLKGAYEVARTGTDERQPYVSALEAILKAMDPTAQTGDTNISEITALLTGIITQTKATAHDGYTLNDLMDPKVVTPNDYKDILNNFKKKYEKLQNIQRKYDYVREFNGLRYYWIPVEDLP